MPLEIGSILAVSHVPEVDRAVLAPDGEGFAIGTEGHGSDPGGMPERCPSRVSRVSALSSSEIYAVFQGLQHFLEFGLICGVGVN
jgi:hypothetical protein